MRKVTFLSIYVSILVLGFLAWSFWPEEKIEDQQQAAQNKVVNESPIENEPSSLADMLAPPQTPQIASSLPEMARISDPLHDNEAIALSAASSFLESNNLSAYDNLRQQWSGRETDHGGWLFLDAAERLQTGQRQAAIDILDSTSLTGTEETERLIRLAALNVVEAPQKAWGYLVEASAKDPSNPDLQTFKASLLESANKKDMALKEYISAVKKEPSDPYLKQQLADFYLRAEHYPQALQVLQESLKAPSLDSLWVQALFWSSVVSPFDTTLNVKDIPIGELEPLAAYLQALPTGIYWNAEAFARLPDAAKYLASRQETFWLRLLAALKTGNYNEALQLMNVNPFQSDLWAPLLSRSLKTILNYQNLYKFSKLGLAAIPQTAPIDAEAFSSDQKFLETLASLSDLPPQSILLNPEMRDFVLSKEVFAAIFLANGWEEAGIQLHVLSIIPESYPKWIAYAVTKALHNNRSDEAALAFAKQQTPSNELTLLTAELALADGRRQEAFNLLANIYKQKDAAGNKAALLIAPLFLDQSNTKGAKEAILGHSDLSNNVQARELLARAFLKEGEQETAYRLYLSIENYSSEAKSYLVRKAFIDKDWPNAKKLTEELIENHPDNTVLRENLKKINAEMLRN